MPKLPPFALAAPTKTARPYYLAIFFVVFAAPLFLIHLPLLGLPFFWDEQGQFIPTALDLLLADDANDASPDLLRELDRGDEAG